MRLKLRLNSIERLKQKFITLTDQKGRVGYDAYVGERGASCLVDNVNVLQYHVFLKDAPILILDEATST